MCWRMKPVVGVSTKPVAMNKDRGGFWYGYDVAKKKSVLAGSRDTLVVLSEGKFHMMHCGRWIATWSPGLMVHRAGFPAYVDFRVTNRNCIRTVHAD